MSRQLLMSSLNVRLNPLTNLSITKTCLDETVLTTKVKEENLIAEESIDQIQVVSSVTNLSKVRSPRSVTLSVTS